ncbi:hypothetical protein JXA80_14630 [bacterium]|nr:hypothetical protein [candidate division CSSED10-310 bacterium]
MRRKTGFMLIAIGMGIAVSAAIAQEPSMTAREKAGKILDTLLLDTPHVYILPSHQIQAFHLPETGWVYTGNITMDSRAGIGGGIPVHAIRWAGPMKLTKLHMLGKLSALSRLSELAKLADVPALKESGVDFSELAKLSELAELSALSKLAEADSGPGMEWVETLAGLDDEMKVEGDDESGEGTVIILRDKVKSCESGTGSPGVRAKGKTDKERLDAFKIELVETLTAHAELFAGETGDSLVTVILQVGDDGFKTIQGADYLRTQIPADRLVKLKGASASDPKTIEAFRFNW